MLKELPGKMGFDERSEIPGEWSWMIEFILVAIE